MYITVRLAKLFRVAALLIAAVYPPVGAANALNPATVTPQTTPNLGEVSAKLAALQVPFVPNAGQWEKQVAFAAHTFAGTLFVTTEGKLVYSLPGKPHEKAGRPGADPHEKVIPRTSGWVLTETFLGVDKKPLTAKPLGHVPAEGKVSYLVGDVKRHTPALDTFERVRWVELYPGVDVELRATGSNVEKIFTVKPHQDPTQMRLKLDGATKLTLGKAGDLTIHTGNGKVTYTAPVAYQEDEMGRRTDIKVAYALHAASNSYSFKVGEYDSDKVLVIDPLLQSTYLGGTGGDAATALAIHPVNGDVYVAGQTESTNFPGVTGGAQPVYGGGTQDAFVSRLNANLTTLVQSTYLGGTVFDAASAVAIHPVSGEVYVAGQTDSTNFPGVTGGPQSLFGGGITDAFISRLDASLTTLAQSTYLGGNGVDVARAIYLVSGAVYVAGQTTSTNFPGVAGGSQATIGGLTDAFASSLNANLTTLAQSTYLGGNGNDVALALALHPVSGGVYVAGQTTSTNFPGVAGGAQATIGGNTDAFASSLNANLTTLAQSTYLGSTLNDFAQALAIHPASGEVYVAGRTDSNPFPGVTGGSQPVYGGGAQDAFASRLNANLTALAQSTYLGGAGDDRAFALAIHPGSGEVYVAGQTESIGFPRATGGPQAIIGGATDAFASRLNANLTALAQSTYLGGTAGDVALALAIHPASGEVYVAGFANSTDLPGVTGGAQPATGGGFDAIVSRISRGLALVDTPSAPTIGTATAGNARATVTFTAPVSDGGSPVTGYTATCGAATASGAASPITVTGLANGTAVTCSVAATNAIGTSTASAASNSVTPVASGSGGGGGGGGGCVLNENNGTAPDPSLPVLMALAGVYVLRRRIKK